MKNTKRALCLLLILAMTLALFAGCSGKEPANETEASNNSQETTADTQPESSGISFPLEEKVTLTVWCPINVQASAIMDDYNGSLVFQEMEKRTNVHIEFIHPAAGQVQEQFNLMIASGEYPDMIMGGITYYPGGGDVAIEDEVFLKLNDLIAQYAPNYTALLENDPEAKRQTITDLGNMTAVYPIMRVDNLCWHGPVLNKQWLDETGMDVPETLAQWEAVLTAMKENHPDGVPLVFQTNNGAANGGFRGRGYDTWGVFMSAFGLGCSQSNGLLFNDNGTVKHAATQPEFEKYLEMMNRWYKNGLIDIDFPARDNDGVNALIASNQVGACVGSLELIAAMFTSQGVDYVTAPYPVMNEGDAVHLRAYDPVASPAGNSVSITTDCENPEIAMAWLDYAFSEEGCMLYNYGVEGETYEMVDGSPVFTDLVLNNPDVNIEQASYKYKMHVFPQWRYGAWANPGTLVKDRILQERIDWTEGSDSDYALPPLTLTAEESSQYSKIITTTDVYQNEMVVKFIMGVEPLDKFDEYVQSLKDMGIDDAVNIYQNAMERYLNR